MENLNFESNFWNLLGGVSGTLSAFAFILITFYHEQINKILDEISIYNLKVYNIIYNQIIILLIFFILPFFQSLLVIGVKEQNKNIILILLISFAVYIISLLYELFLFRKVNSLNKNFFQVKIRYLMIGIIFLIFFTMYFYIESDFVLKLLAGLSLLTGFIILFFILTFYDKHKLIIEIDQNFLEETERTTVNNDCDKLILKNLHSKYLDVTSQYKAKKNRFSEEELKKIIAASKDFNECIKNIEELKDYINKLHLGCRISYLDFKWMQNAKKSIEINFKNISSNLNGSIDKAAELGYTPN